MPDPVERPDGVPDFVNEKFFKSENPIEAQARAYQEAMQQFTKKTEDLKVELRGEVEAERMAVVPENNGYEYPDGWAPPEENIDTAFREWAGANGLSQEQFDEAVKLYGQTQTEVDHEAELAKLGPNAQARIDEVSRLGSVRIPQHLHEKAMSVMNTAEGVELVEALLGVKSSSPATPGVPNPITTQSAEDLRAELIELKKTDDYKAGKIEAVRAADDLARRAAQAKKATQRK